MPQFMTVHRAPGLLPENWDDNAAAIHSHDGAKFQQAFVNLSTGFIFTIYEAESRDALVETFEELGLPFEEINEIQFSQSFDEMKARLEQLGRA